MTAEIAPDDERELVAAAVGGSADAFGALAEQHRLAIWRLALRLTRDADDAKDVTQETLLRAYRGIEAFRPERPFARWLLAIARNASLDALRRRRRLAASELDYEPGDDSLGPEDLIVRDDEAARVRAAIAVLPPRYRRALDLFYVDRLRYREIADQLDIPIGTVKTFISRAKARLRDALHDEFGEDVSTAA